MTQKAKNGQNNRSLLIIAGVVIVALVGLAAVIFLQGAGSGTFNYDGIPTERTEDGAFILGDPDAPVTIVAFEDFLCPHCQSYQPELKRFFADHVATGEARFEFRMLRSTDPTFSGVAFSLAECANEIEEGAFWPAHDMLFDIASTERFDSDSARTFAERMDMSYSTLLECIEEPGKQWEVDGQLASGIERITGTPFIAYRVDGGELRFDLSPRPTAGQISSFLDGFAQLGS